MLLPVGPKPKHVDPAKLFGDKRWQIKYAHLLSPEWSFLFGLDFIIILILIMLLYNVTYNVTTKPTNDLLLYNVT
jgi:hypothetical protein